MKKFIFILLISFFSLKDEAQNFEWVRSCTNGYSEFSRSIELDAAGNVYSFGTFSGIIDFDPGPGVFNLSSNANSAAISIQELDSAGNFVWAGTICGAGFAGASDMKIDLFGNLLITGSFADTVDFDPGPGVHNLIGGLYETFILKLDKNHNFAWVQQLPNHTSGNGSACFVKTDISGNVIVTGSFSGIFDFDASGNTANLISNGSAQDVFILKVDSSGNYLWAKNIGNTSNDIASSISIDGLDNIYCMGTYKNTTDFDPGPGIFNLTSAGPSEDVFIMKLDATGNFLWAKSVGATGTDFGYELTTDNFGNLYSTGYFTGTGDFDPGPGVYTLSTVGGPDCFILKLDLSGNFKWVKQIAGGISPIEGRSIDTDANGTVYTAGTFIDTTDFDPGPGIYNMVGSSTVQGLFILKLDSSGIFNWAGAVAFSYPHIRIDNQYNIYIQGTYMDTTDFDPGVNVFNISPDSFSWDVFVLKLSQNMTSMGPPVLIPDSANIYPNPAQNYFSIENISAGTSLKLYDVTGRLVMTQKVNSSNITMEKYDIDVSHLQNGIFILEVSSETGRSFQRLVISR